MSPCVAAQCEMHGHGPQQRERSDLGFDHGPVIASAQPPRNPTSSRIGHWMSEANWSVVQCRPCISPPTPTRPPPGVILGVIAGMCIRDQGTPIWSSSSSFRRDTTSRNGSFGTRVSWKSEEEELVAEISGEESHTEESWITSSSVPARAVCLRAKHTGSCQSVQMIICFKTASHGENRGTRRQEKAPFVKVWTQS